MLELQLNEKNYKSFIDFASKTCDLFSLVFVKSELHNFEYIFQDIFLLLSESVVRKQAVLVHPNTGTHFENADILYLRINLHTISFLKQTNSIYDWNGENLPEELCFLRNGNVWFSCVGHERLLRIHSNTSQDLKFFTDNKIKYLNTGES